MFTGIVEETGIIKEFKKGAKDAFIKVECSKVLEETKIGDSISINGICQTVTQIDNKSFSAQISNETLCVTTFQNAKQGDIVNLERALTLCQRLGGHIVSGHVDGVAKITSVKKSNHFYELEITLPKELTKYTVKKGSVTINGISLTIANIASDAIKTAIIPHTFENTMLKTCKAGDFVNIEVDILAKYVEKILLTNDNRVSKSNIDETFLKENGFF